MTNVASKEGHARLRHLGVTFRQKGFRDVYWCHKVGEPTLLRLNMPGPFGRFNLMCTACGCGYVDVREMTKDRHEFICHIQKPRHD